MHPVSKLVVRSLFAIVLMSLFSARLSAGQLDDEASATFADMGAMNAPRIAPGDEASATQQLQLYIRPPRRLWPVPFMLPATPADGVVEQGERFMFRNSREVFVYPERSLWWQIEIQDNQQWLYLGPVAPQHGIPNFIQLLEESDDASNDRGSDVVDPIAGRQREGRQQ